MFSLRKWLYKPKRTDSSLLAQFYYADEALCDIATELDSFDGRREPERCARLVGLLRHCQDSVLQYIQRIMDEAIPSLRASRDFRVKYPDDLIQEGLSGQLWFGAECLAAGSSILNREVESASMRPLARSLTKQLDGLRAALRDMCLSRTGAVASGQLAYPDNIKEGLVAFDHLFADFELSYVSAMVPVKTMKEYEMSQDVAVMFSEAVDRALKRGLIVQDALDNCDPALMFTIPRLAIVTGLVMTADGPLNPDVPSSSMSEMFRPFQTLLKKIRELLRSLTDDELYVLERILCNFDDSRGAHALGGSEASSSVAAGGRAERQALLRRRRTHTAASFASSNGNSSSDAGAILACVRCRCLATGSSKTDGGKEQHAVEPSAAAVARATAVVDSDSHTCEPRVTNPKDSASIDENVERRVAEAEEHDGEQESSGSAAGKALPERRNVSIQTDGGCRSSSRSVVGNSSGDRQCCKQTRGGRAPAAAGPTASAAGRTPSAPPSVESAAAAAAAGAVAPQAVAGQYAFWLPDRTDSRRVTVERSISYEGAGGSGGSAAAAAAAARARLAADDAASASDLSANGYSSAAAAACSAECSVCGDTVSSSQSSLCSLGDGDSAAGEEEEDDGGSCGSCEDDFAAAAAACGGQANGDCGSIAPGNDCTSQHGEAGMRSGNAAASRDASSAGATRAAEGRTAAGGRGGTSSDLVHKLFVCISGVADQLQTNFASDLRGILKYVFDIHTSALSDDDDDERASTSCDSSTLVQCPPATGRTSRHNGTSNGSASASGRVRGPAGTAQLSPPPWVPDELNPQCSACKIPFTFVRRRHHCRNCGQIFCHRCSSNWAPLPNYGYDKPVRVCTKCFVYHVDPFAMDPSSVPANGAVGSSVAGGGGGGGATASPSRSPVT